MKSLYTLRVSDDYRHSEKFTVRSRPDLTRGLLDAIGCYLEWKNDYTPKLNSGNETVATSHTPEFSLHLLDPWMTRREGNSAWVVCSTEKGALPVVSARAAFLDGCATMWQAVLHTAHKVEETAKFLGYHENGEHRLSDLLKCLDADEPALSHRD